jgi:uncharacterized damage-inducible protein DinB
MDQQQVTVLRDADILAFRAEHVVTRRVIEAIPPDRSDFKPDPVVKSALELAWHIVGAEHRFVDAVIQGAFDFTNTGKPASLATPADVARWYAGTFEDDMSRLARVTPEQLVKPIDFRGLFQRPAVAFLRIGLSHSIHHRGQLSMYLRPMGAKVPAIYGESFDSAEAKKAAGLG